MKTALKESQDLEDIEVADILPPATLDRIDSFHARYKSQVESVAKAFQHANLWHSHYWPDGPDPDWKVHHQAADALLVMFRSISRQNPTIGEVSYRYGRNNRKTVCVNKDNFFEQLAANAGYLKTHLDAIAERKTDAEMTREEHEQFSGYAILERLLQDEIFQREFAVLSAEIELAMARHAFAIAQFTELNKAMEARERAVRLHRLAKSGNGDGHSEDTSGPH